MAHLDARPLLFVVSGPSGAGKGTALRALAEEGVNRVPTYTTRAMRPNETDGVDYRFVTEDFFFEAFKEGRIFEYTRTYAESYYGSPDTLLTAEVDLPIASEMDPSGFVRVRAASARRVVGLFVATSREDTLRERIMLRGQGNELKQRMRIRTDQMTWAWMYDYVIFNDGDPDEFKRSVTTAVRAETMRTQGAHRMLELKVELDPTLKDNL